jgi:UTP--glucose-1-phosphate uridylyltransferase
MNHTQLFLQKMHQEGLPPIIQNTFAHYYQTLRGGVSGLLCEKDIAPVPDDALIHQEQLAAPYRQAGVQALGKTAVLKLNGGLGTSMGLQQAKSLIAIKENLSFLDCAVLQSRALQQHYGIALPLIFMNSFSTHADTLEALQRYPQLQSDIPSCFVQHKYPKIMQEDLGPALYPQHPEREWNPPGHGDLYPALVTSGLLQKLLSKNISYLFISNCDNLGALLDMTILGYMARHQLDFLMEVAYRTPMDSKGGHLALTRQGQLLLRERAQCPKEELERFEDIKRYRYFNTNNLWLNLHSLKAKLDREGPVLNLPIIINPKPLDPSVQNSPAVYQIETAMGSAIQVFENSAAIVVPRSRFAPVKKSNDLLNIWSDRFLLDEFYQLRPNPACTTDSIFIELDNRYYEKIDDLHRRFPHGSPSLRNCSSLRIHGDIVFGESIQCQGDVTLTTSAKQQVVLANKESLHGHHHF